MLPSHSENYQILPFFFPRGNTSTVDIISISKICSEGLKRDSPPEDRCLAWLAMLKIYPQDPKNWNEKRDSIFSEYTSFVNEFGVSDWHKQVFPINVESSEFNVDNKQQMDLIHRDIVRMGNQICFFPAMEIPPGVEPGDQLGPFTEHIRRLERILYIFGAINRSFGYMQGFNELLPPIYYVLIVAKSLFSNNLDIVEALAFFCIQQLLTDSDFQTFYAHEDQQLIIDRKLQEFEILLRQRLPKLSAQLVRLQIKPFCYCYKWVTLLFAQEYDLPEILILWDSIFAHFNAMVKYSFCVAIGRLEMTQEQFENADYKKTMNLLMSPSNFRDIYKLIIKSNKIYQETQKKRRFSLFPTIKMSS